MFILQSYSVLLQETETIGYFWLGFFGVGFFIIIIIIFSHCQRSIFVFFLLSPCTSSSVGTVHTSLADVFPNNLVVIFML